MWYSLMLATLLISMLAFAFGIVALVLIAFQAREMHRLEDKFNHLYLNVLSRLDIEPYKSE